MDFMVSVNCIAYNQEKYVGKTLESILAQQTKFRYEILVHDDASTDNTAGIISRYAQEQPEIIKPMFQAANQHSKGIRVGTAFNIPRARGKYIAYCEGDDFWTDPLKLQKQVDYMESHPECSFCFHAVQIVNNQGKSTGKLIRPYLNNRTVPIESIIEGGGRFLGTNSTLYRRELMSQPPAFYLKAPVGDFPLVLYLATRGTVYYLDEVMSAYRTGVPGSWTNRMVASTEQQLKVRKGMIEMIEAFDEYTSHKYASSVKIRRIEYDLLLLIARGDVKALSEDKYRPYRKNYGLFLVILIYLNRYFPKLFHRMRKYYRLLPFIANKLN